MDPTARVQLGQTRLTVTRLGLGTAPLGGLFRPVDEAEARAVVGRAWELGLRLFDTAPQYGHGLAEQRLGAVLRDWPRGEFTLATKVGRLLRPGAPQDPREVRDGAPIYQGVPADRNVVYDFSYDGVLRSFEESLQRLGLDRVDILHIHDPDFHEREVLEGAFRALARLRADGVIGAVGAGMNQAEMLARFARAAEFDCFLLAGRYTLLDQAGLRELLPLCAERGIAVIVGGAYNSGILADPRAGATFNYNRADQERLDQAIRLEAVCARYGVPLKAAAIQFPLGHPAVAAVLTGARSVAELDDNERMFRWRIPAGLWADLKSEGLLPEQAPVPQ